MHDILSTVYICTDTKVVHVLEKKINTNFDNIYVTNTSIIGDEFFRHTCVSQKNLE